MNASPAPAPIGVDHAGVNAADVTALFERLPPAKEQAWLAPVEYGLAMQRYGVTIEDALDYMRPEGARRCQTTADRIAVFEAACQRAWRAKKRLARSARG